MKREPLPSDVIIRHAQVTDAQVLIELRCKLYAQTQYMLWEDGEYLPNLEHEEGFINAFTQSDNSTVLVAIKNGLLVGFMGVAGGRTRRIRHCADVFLGVDESMWGQGVGWLLMQFLNNWAQTTPLRRLALSTAVDNERGLVLYEKAGFVIEGIKKGDIMLGDKPVDSYFMAKLIEDN